MWFGAVGNLVAGVPVIGRAEPAGSDSLLQLFHFELNLILHGVSPRFRSVLVPTLPPTHASWRCFPGLRCRTDYVWPSFDCLAGHRSRQSRSRSVRSALPILRSLAVSGRSSYLAFLPIVFTLTRVFLCLHWSRTSFRMDEPPHASGSSIQAWLSTAFGAY